MLEKLLTLLGEAAALESEMIANVTYPKGKDKADEFKVILNNGESFIVRITKEK